MKTPKFYYQKPGLLAISLAPLSFLFLFASLLRKSCIKKHKLENKFVICIGNLTLGGAGKTPSAIFLGSILKEMGLSFCFLSKGYGRKTKGFLKAESNNALETGDEPQLLKNYAPVYLFSKYKEISENIEKIKEKFIIMDDGMQNPYIQKDATILVIDSNLKFGNGFLFPAGPLRELPQSRTPDITFEIEGRQNNKQNIITLSKEYQVINSENANNFIAFSGLAVNKKFFSSLEQLGLNVVKKIEFEDHHKYMETEIVNLITLANQLQCKLITTEKDIVKIPEALKSEIAILKLKLTASEEGKNQIKTLLKNKIII